MKGSFVQTTLWGIDDLKKIVETGIIGINFPSALSSQVPLFADKPMAYCSYVNKFYSQTYGDREGVIFETDTPIVYSCPVDSLELMRGGNWLPGYEKFIFLSLEEMLKKYPTPLDFKKDFQKYFKNLQPKEVYPNNDFNFAESHFETDYCLADWWNPAHNEVTFPKPLKIKNAKIFSSREELKKLIDFEVL